MDNCQKNALAVREHRQSEDPIRNPVMKNQNQAAGKNSTTDSKSQVKLPPLIELESAKNQSNALLYLLADSIDWHNTNGHWTEEHGNKMGVGIYELVHTTTGRLGHAFDAVWDEDHKKHTDASVITRN